MHPTEVPELPWEQIYVDLLGPITKDKITGDDMIVVISDKLTKQIHLVPTTQDIDAERTADIYLKNVWKYHGVPKKVISDRGPQFASKFMRSLLERVGSKAALSTAYHPQTDGQSERLMQEIEIYLRAFIDYRQEDWARWLPIAEFAHNVKPHSATGKSPFEILQGFNPQFTISNKITDIPSLDERLKNLVGVREEAVAAQKIYADIMKEGKKINKKHQKTFEVGDLVLLDGTNIKTNRPTKKLDHKRFGPYKIIEKLGELTYRLELPDALKALHNVFHIEKLVPYVTNQISGREDTRPPPIEIEGNEEYEVQEILDCRRRRNKWEYLVSWKGYGPNENSWEPRENVENAQDKINQFHTKHPSAPDPRTK